MAKQIVLLKSFKMYKSLLLLFVLVANNALACQPPLKNRDHTLNLGNFVQDNILIDTDNIGTNLYPSETVDLNFYNYSFCNTGSGSSHWFIPSKPLSSETLTDGYGDWSLYETAIDGIYYAVQAKDSQVNVWQETGAALPLRTTPNTDGSYRSKVRSKLVLKGRIMPGSYTINEPFGKVALSNYQTMYASFGSEYEINVFGTANIEITGPTCDINAADKDQTVVMNAISSSFTGVGSTATPTNFQIRLNCEAGVSLIAYMVDSNTPGNTGQILSLGHHSTVSGFGLRLFANGNTTPVSFGKMNKWNIGGPASDHQKNYLIPFMAEYIQTDATVTTGTVEAQSTITFLYH